MHIRTPPWAETDQGETRRVGVEIEFAGVDPEASAEALETRLGGSIERESAFCFRVEGTELGDFRVELDMAVLKKLGAQIEEGSESSVSRQATELIGKVAGSAVPTEIVAPPIAWDRLEELEDVIQDLVRIGAEGTQESVLFAFGVHLNPECASFQDEHLRRVIQSYACLHDWLVVDADVDLVRRVTPFIDAYPESYERCLLAADYRPDRAGLIDDYLEHNPTRNRALDMLPAFCFLDRDRVRERLPDEKINRRPTYHFRLPNCEIGRDGWSLGKAWSHWVSVETLAADGPGLSEVCSARLEHLDAFHLSSGASWAEKVDERWAGDL